MHQTAHTALQESIHLQLEVCGLSQPLCIVYSQETRSEVLNPRLSSCVGAHVPVKQKCLAPGNMYMSYHVLDKHLFYREHQNPETPRDLSVWCLRKYCVNRHRLQYSS